MKKENLSLKEKKQLLARLIELHILTGYSIIGFIGKPLSYFDFDKVNYQIKLMENEYEKM